MREEPGCLAFEPHRVAAAPAGSAVSAGPEPIGTRFIVVEAYRDEEAFAAHLAASYGAIFNAALVSTPSATTPSRRASPASGSTACS